MNKCEYLEELDLSYNEIEILENLNNINIKELNISNNPLKFSKTNKLNILKINKMEEEETKEYIKNLHIEYYKFKKESLTPYLKKRKDRNENIKRNIIKNIKSKNNNEIEFGY